MDSKTTLILFWWLVLLIIIIFITVYIIRNRKWKIIINTIKNSFTYWENISWNFDLIAKKNIIWNWLYCELLWYNTTYQRDHNWNNNRQDVLVYSSKTEIENAREYYAWYQNTYNFNIPSPNESPNTIPQTDSNLLNTIIKIWSIWAWRNLKRYIKITLDAKWLDIIKKKEIYIN
jgi:hypothetical protein